VANLRTGTLDFKLMRIVVTFAVEAEFAPWRKLRKFQPLRVRPHGASENTDIWETLIGETAVTVYLTGIGRGLPRDAVEMREAFFTSKLDLAISSGLAGALKEGLKPGDLIVPLKVRSLRNDASADSDSVSRERAIQRGALPIETLITVDRIVPTAEEKARLAFFGQAVDMESARIMSHFAAVGVPVLTIRAVSDSADEDLPIDFDRCLTPQGGIKPMSLVNAIVRQPSKLPDLVRFGRQSNQAAQRLAGFLDDFIAALPVGQEKVATV
jgi:adenosylhomocysteine nucleosidase